MPLDESQKQYIVQNFTHTDEQLAEFLKVDIKEVEAYTKTVAELIVSMKEMSKTKKTANISIELISAIDVLMIVTIPSLALAGQKQVILESLKNLIYAAETGQFSNLLLEALRRSKDTNTDYLEVYTNIRDYLKSSRDNEDIITPCNVLSAYGERELKKYD